MFYGSWDYHMKIKQRHKSPLLNLYTQLASGDPIQAGLLYLQRDHNKYIWTNYLPDFKV